MLLRSNQQVTHLRMENTQFFAQKNWEPTLQQALKDESFQEPIGEMPATVMGLTDVWRVDDSEFESLNRFVHPKHVLFSLRIDSRSVPSKYLKQETDKKISAWLEEQGLERCPAAVRKEFRESVESMLMRRAIPKTKSIQIAICIETGETFLFGGISEKVYDAARKKLYSVFGVKFTMWHDKASAEMEEGKNTDLARAFDTAVRPIEMPVMESA